MFCEAITAYGEPLQRLDTPTPQPQGTEVLLEITECGVCHSDVHLHDGYFGMGGDNKLDVRAGRKRAEIEVSISPYMQPIDFDAVRRYRDAGVDQVILLVVAGNRDGLLARLDDLAKTIVEPARRL